MTKFPKVSTTIDASSDENMSSAFTRALRNVDPSASFSAVTVRLSSSDYWLNLTIALTVTGTTQAQGDIAVANTTWRAFNITSDLRAGNLSYNTLGTRYFRHVVDFYVNASKIADRPNATIRAVTFFVNETQSVPGPEAANAVGNFTVLDFRSLNVPLDQWNRTYTLPNDTTTWRYTPPLMLAASVHADQLNKSITLFSHYGYNAEIIVPGLAHATGNVVRVDIGSGQKEWIMMGVVILAVVVALAAQLLFRSKKKSTRLQRR